MNETLCSDGFDQATANNVLAVEGANYITNTDKTLFIDLIIFSP